MAHWRQAHDPKAQLGSQWQDAAIRAERPTVVEQGIAGDHFLSVAAVRRFVWPDGNTADAVTLFDDLHLGLFVRDSRLVLADW